MSVDDADRQKIEALLARYDAAYSAGNLEDLLKSYSFRMHGDDLGSRLWMRRSDGSHGPSDADVIARNARKSLITKFNKLEPALRTRLRSRIKSIEPAQTGISRSEPAPNLRVLDVSRRVQLGEGLVCTEKLRVGRRAFDGFIDRILSSIKGRSSKWYVLDAEMACEKVLSDVLGKWSFEYDVWSTARRLSWLGNRKVMLSAAGQLAGVDA